MGQDVVDSTGQGLDWAVEGASAFLVDALAFDTILLIGHANGGLCCSEEGGEWLVVGDERPVGSAESYVLDPDGDGVGFGGARFGVLTNPQEVVESNVGQVSSGLLPGAAVGVLPGLLKQVFGETDGDSQLWG